MDTDVKPSDLDLAARVLQAAGVDLATLPDAAIAQLDRAQARAARQAKDDTPRGETPAEPPDPRELWITNSGQQLHRWFGGRCVTCVNFTPGKESAGTCQVIADAVGLKGAASVSATFGCTLYAEIPVDDTDTIRARTELGFVLGLLQPYPGGDEPEPAPEVADASANRDVVSVRLDTGSR